MATIHEIAPDAYRIATYRPEIDFAFSHFLVKDEEPLLYHTGHRATFAELAGAVRKLIDPAAIRWIGFSHFESDECGSLNDWLEIAPRAEVLAGVVGASVNLSDFAIRPARALADGETISTGNYRFRYCATPHLPHGWDAGLLFEETRRTLFCSDLFAHKGDAEPLIASGIVELTLAYARSQQSTPFAHSVPYTPTTERILESLASLDPATLAVMHGSSLAGEGATALRGLAEVYRECFGQEPLAGGDHR